MNKISDNTCVIIDAIRTPFGKKDGALKNKRPDELLAFVLHTLIDRSGLDANVIGDVIAGCVSQAGEQGANIARQALLLAGYPESVPGVTLNRMCGSSQYAAHAAAQAVVAGDINVAIGCGVESMSRVPMFLDLTLGNHAFEGFDNLHKNITRRFPIPHQVESAERIAHKWGISREELDDYSARSHLLASKARTEGLHSEIIPIEGINSDESIFSLNSDEGVRDSIDMNRMATMKPVLRDKSNAVVTAANASQMSDGSAAVLISTANHAKHLNIRPRAKFVARVVTGSDPVMQLTGILPATHSILQKTGLSIHDIDWIEVNEAFASVALCFLKEFKPRDSVFNPWGGAIAHGHPLGATGAGLMAKMLAGLESIDGQFGLQVMCIGHGMATATIIERV